MLQPPTLRIHTDRFRRAYYHSTAPEAALIADTLQIQTQGNSFRERDHHADHRRPSSAFPCSPYRSHRPPASGRPSCALARSRGLRALTRRRLANTGHSDTGRRGELCSVVCTLLCCRSCARTARRTAPVSFHSRGVAPTRGCRGRSHPAAALPPATRAWGQCRPLRWHRSGRALLRASCKRRSSPRPPSRR